MDQNLITRIVEAALLAANQPLTLAQLNGLFPEDQPAPAGAVAQAIGALQEACADRGVELVELASGFRYQVKSDVHPWVARLWTERQTRYTRATLETLALIAYRQPITRGEIEQVRGVAVSSNIIKSLEEREWIRVVGHRDVPGKPALFGTTKAFLDYFGLKRLDELPPLSELKEIGELEPQFKFDGGPGDKPAPAEGEAIAAGGIGRDGDAIQDGDAARDAAGSETDDSGGNAPANETETSADEPPTSVDEPQPVTGESELVDDSETPADGSAIPGDAPNRTEADQPVAPEPQPQDDDAELASSEQEK
jgi:segregation and condensation protein B